MSERQTLIKRMATALYDYAMARTHATWDKKRPGLDVPKTPGVHYRSCGAFREWALHAHDDFNTVGFSMDGYTHRNGRTTGAVFVLVGDGRFIFPADNSCSYHSLALKASDGAKLVNVTVEGAIAWDEGIICMCEVLETTKRDLDQAISEYDEQAHAKIDSDRKEELSAARAEIAKAKPRDSRKDRKDASTHQTVR